MNVGVSCGSLGLMLGLSALSMVLRIRFPHVDNPNYSVKYFYTFSFVIIALVSIFDHWIMFLSSILISVFIGYALFVPTSIPSTIEVEADYELDQDMNKNNITSDQKKHYTPRMKIWILLSLTYTILLSTILLNKTSKPNENYTMPYLTGCDMMYSTAILEDTCCQICIPKSVSSIITSYSLIEKFAGYEFAMGMCDEVGYEEHAVDKTFKYFSYALDVEVYYPV